MLTISDTRSLADDKSGATLADRLTAAGHHLAAREIVIDDVDAIRVIIRRWIADSGVDAIITTGGTGFTGRDVTPEAVEPLFEKRMDGFSIAFHMLSHAKIGASTIQSRATAGVAGATFIFCLPGSPGACRDGWDGILGPQLDYRTRPCNFVEIMPRLDEHLRRPKAKGASAVGWVDPSRKAERLYKRRRIFRSFYAQIAARHAAIGLSPQLMRPPFVIRHQFRRDAPRVRRTASQFPFPGLADQALTETRCGSVATSSKPAS